MTWVNGRIPLADLAPVKPYGYLRKDAAAAYTAMQAAAARDGVVLRPEGPSASTYRTYAWQVSLRNYWCSRGMCFRAAAPGTSNHGWAVAVDFYMGPGVYAWLSAHAHSYGFSHDEGARVGESWHWRYVGGFYPAPVHRDPLWFLTSRERKVVHEYRALGPWKHLNRAQRARHRELRHWMLRQRTHIAHAAHHGYGKAPKGWHVNHRGARYKLLGKVAK